MQATLRHALRGAPLTAALALTAIADPVPSELPGILVEWVYEVPAMPAFLNRPPTPARLFRRRIQMAGPLLRLEDGPDGEPTAYRVYNRAESVAWQVSADRSQVRDLEQRATSAPRPAAERRRRRYQDHLATSKALSSRPRHRAGETEADFRQRRRRQFGSNLLRSVAADLRERRERPEGPVSYTPLATGPAEGEVDFPCEPFIRRIGDAPPTRECVVRLEDLDLTLDDFATLGAFREAYLSTDQERRRWIHPAQVEREVGFAGLPALRMSPRRRAPLLRLVRAERTTFPTTSFARPAPSPTTGGGTRAPPPNRGFLGAPSR